MLIELNKKGKEEIYLKRVAECEFEVLQELEEHYVVMPVLKYEDKNIPERMLIDKIWVKQ